MRLFLFTDKFPYGKQETFLENELPFLSQKFEEIIIIPLHKTDELRKIPHNVKVWQPILAFNPKNKKKLLLNGILNFSPFLFAMKEVIICLHEVLQKLHKISNKLKLRRFNDYVKEKTKN